MPKHKRPGKPPPITQAQLNKVKREVAAQAVTDAMALFLTVLVDKFNGEDYVKDVWREVNNLSDSVIQGYVSIHDLREVLYKEYGIKT